MGLITIWGDESSQNAHKFMVLGTVWQNPICAVDLQREIHDLRMKFSFSKEFHWTEMKKLDFPVYSEAINIFKKYYDQGFIKYRAIVVDQTDPVHREYSPDNELHFYKMYFWLIYKRLRHDNKYDILLDRKRNKVDGRLSDLRNSLNNKCYTDHVNNGGKVDEYKNIIRRVEPRDGTQIELQFADIFTGAIAYVRNGSYEKADNPMNPKLRIVNYIQEKMKINLREGHPHYINQGFNIWDFKRFSKQK